MLLKELNRQKRWYVRAVKVFKENQNKWLEKQIKTFTDKQIVIRYVFLDDIKRIRVFRPSKTETKWKNRIRFRDHTGGDIVLKDIEFEIVNKDDDDGTNDNDQDENEHNDVVIKKQAKPDSKSKQIMPKTATASSENKITSKKQENKNKQSVNKSSDVESENNNIARANNPSEDDQAAEIEKYIAEYMQEFNISAAVDDMKDDLSADDEPEEEEDDTKEDENDAESALKSANKLSSEDNERPDDILSVGSDGHDVELEAQIMNLVHEFEDRNEDLKQLQEIITNKEEYPNPKESLNKIFEDIKIRHEKLGESLKDIHFDIKQLQNTNNQWSLLLNDTSNLIFNGRVNLDKLIHFYEYFAKELKGRLQDLMKINAIYYNQEGDVIQEDTKESNDNNDNVDHNEMANNFGSLKISIHQRHLNIQNALSPNGTTPITTPNENETKTNDQETDNNKDEVQEILNLFFKQNTEWNVYVQQSATKHDSSIDIKTQLVSTILNHQKEISRLMEKVNLLPKYSLNIDNVNDEIPNEQNNNEISNEQNNDEVSNEQNNNNNEN